MSLVVDRGQRVDRPRGQRTDPHPRPARRQHPDSAPPGREAPHRVVGWAHRNAPLCPVAGGKDTQQISSSRHHERRVPAAATERAPLPTVPPSSLQREGLCPRLHPSRPPWGGQCGPRCTWGTLCPVLDTPRHLPLPSPQRPTWGLALLCTLPRAKRGRASPPSLAGCDLGGSGEAGARGKAPPRAAQPPAATQERARRRPTPAPAAAAAPGRFLRSQGRPPAASLAVPARCHLTRGSFFWWHGWPRQ